MDKKKEALFNLCCRVRQYLEHDEYRECKEDICYSMYLQPDAPEPHNLMGILMKKQQDHKSAIKHFRAALDLDPYYTPAKQNLMEYTKIGSEQEKDCYCFDDCTGKN